MRQISWLVLLGALTIGATACDGGGTPTAESPVAVEEAPVAIPIPSTAPQSATTPPLDTVVVGSLPPELIASTNANQRVQEVQRNRPDPFARVATAPIVQVERTAQPAPPSQPSAAPQPSRSSSSSSNASRNGSGGSSLRPGQLAPIPNLVPGAGRAAAPQLPPEPQPSLARAVQVSGVVQIGNVPYAIVTAPNEPTSRYVRVGQMLSNGEVLVKRIEMSQGYEPVVILEQLGVEVVRSVGGSGAPTT